MSDEHPERVAVTGVGRGGSGVVYPCAPGERRGGRAPGTPNHNTRILRDAIMLAAEMTGKPEIERDEKGNIVTAISTGEEGLLGYLKWAALWEPRAFLILLGKVLPLQVNLKAALSGTPRVLESTEEIKQAMVERGIPVQRLFGRQDNIVDITPRVKKTDDAG